MPIPGAFQRLHGNPLFPTGSGIVKILFKGKLFPILFNSEVEIESGLGYILKTVGLLPFVRDESEKDAGDVFFAAFAGGGVGAKRRRFQFIPIQNVQNLHSISPSLAKAGELDDDPSVPIIELIEVDQV